MPPTTVGSDGQQPASGSVFPVGTTVVTATATDAAGNSQSCTFNVTVNDATPPVITLNGQTITLWPPNHKYATVNVADLVASASDLCDPSVNINSVQIAQVTSDEPEDSGGDGNTTNDIVIAANCKSVQLRSERMGGGNGRVYTILSKSLMRRAMSVWRPQQSPCLIHKTERRRWTMDRVHSPAVVLRGPAS